MRVPRIGIPLCLDGAGRIRPGRRYHYLDAAYGEAVVHAGGSPRYLPIQPDAMTALAEIDGLLLPGGDDFPPPTPYPPDVEFTLVEPAQRAFDEALLAEAEERELPVLGICYGMQLLALRDGGSLHHHLPVDRPGCAEHRLGDGPGRHALRLEPGAPRAELFEGLREVNSLHHQALATAGVGMQVAARGPDDSIEAIAAPGPRFVVGVQWHPEKLPPGERGPLFDHFVEAAARRAQAG